jgi:CheY-like chemotaxis protein
MGPAGLLLTMRAVALRLRRRGWTRRRIGLLTGPGRGLEASALPAQCGCWSSAARRGGDGPASSTCRVTPARAESTEGSRLDRCCMTNLAQRQRRRPPAGARHVPRSAESAPSRRRTLPAPGAGPIATRCVMTADQLTLLVAEDHPLVGQDGWDVVAEAEDGIGAVTAAHTMQPDVVLMDLNLPGLDGIEATRRIVAASPHIAVSDDVRRRRIGVRRGSGRRPRIPPQGCRPSRHPPGGHSSRRRRRDLREVSCPPHHRLLRCTKGNSGSGRARLRRTHRARARGTRSHRGRIQQR